MSKRRRVWSIKKKRNPEQTATELARAFHGREPVTEEVRDTIVEHDDLAGLGELIQITLRNGAKIEDFEGAILCSNPDGTQLYVRGGNQEIDISAFEVDPSKEIVSLGKVKAIVYATDKQHLGKADKQAGPYEHQLGEESGEMPTLIYNTLSQRIDFAGGAYFIPLDMDHGRHSSGIHD